MIFRKISCLLYLLFISFIFLNAFYLIYKNIDLKNYEYLLPTTFLIKIILCHIYINNMHLQL